MTRPGNLGCVFAAHAGSDSPAIVDLYDPDRPRTLSHRALDRACGAMAAGLAARGLGRGDRVAICAVNRLEYLVALFGAMRAGCVPVMVNIKLPEETIRFIVEDSGARIVFADGDFVFDPPGGTATVSFDGGGWREFTSPEPVPACVPRPGDIAEQPYTSGSTGRPQRGAARPCRPVLDDRQAGRDPRSPGRRRERDLGPALSQERAPGGEIGTGGGRVHRAVRALRCPALHPGDRAIPAHHADRRADDVRADPPGNRAAAGDRSFLGARLLDGLGPGLGQPSGFARRDLSGRRAQPQLRHHRGRADRVLVEAPGRAGTAADDGGLSDRRGRAPPRRRPGPRPGHAPCQEPGGDGGLSQPAGTTPRACWPTAGSIPATC